MRLLFTTLALCAVVLFTGLGIWQMERRTWKLNLIAQTEHNLQAAPVAAPSPTTPVPPSQAYIRLTATGHFIHSAETPVLAVTTYGRGYWLLTPLQTDSGFVVMVNRGWIPTDRLNPATRPESQPQGPVTVTGLLRLTEPKGAFLRTNNPAQNRWFSRDVPAISTARGISGTATAYFIDADASTSPKNSLPIGGLTVIGFHNSHLVYMLTWFGLALMSACAALYLVAPHRFKRDGTDLNP